MTKPIKKQQRTKSKTSKTDLVTLEKGRHGAAVIQFNLPPLTFKDEREFWLAMQQCNDYLESIFDSLRKLAKMVEES